MQRKGFVYSFFAELLYQEISIRFSGIFDFSVAHYIPKQIRDRLLES